MDQSPPLAYYRPMIGFLLKKTFYDLWDNLFRIALLNLGFLLSASIPIILPSKLAGVPVISLMVLALGVFWCFIYLAASALCVKEISDYGYFGFKDFFVNIRKGLTTGLLLGFICLIILLFGSVALPFYASLNSLIGVFAAALVFWTLAIVGLAVQYVLPVRARLDTKLKKVVKKSFIIFFDNPGLSIFALFHNIIILVISAFLAFLAPGPAGVLLFMDEALRLRLLKYDWLEENPDADRKKIPWDELLIDERERTGSRSLKSFIFPWKD